MARFQGWRSESSNLQPWSSPQFWSGFNQPMLEAVPEKRMLLLKPRVKTLGRWKLQVVELDFLRMAYRQSQLTSISSPMKSTR